MQTNRHRAWGRDSQWGYTAWLFCCLVQLNSSFCKMAMVLAPSLSSSAGTAFCILAIAAWHKTDSPGITLATRWQ